MCYGCYGDLSFVDIDQRSNPIRSSTLQFDSIPPLITVHPSSHVRASNRTFKNMPPLSTLSQADIQLLNDPTKVVKRAQLASLCRKASLKVKGTVI